MTLRATVTATSGTPLPPSGSVTFSAGGTPLGTVIVTGGTATFTTTSLTAGKYTLTAAYEGDTNFTGSAAASVVLQVKGSGKK